METTFDYLRAHAKRKKVLSRPPVAQSREEPGSAFEVPSVTADQPPMVRNPRFILNTYERVFVTDCHIESLFRVACV
jgi:hypothetical protein